MNKRYLYIIFTIIIVALLPSTVFASVVINQSYNVSISSNSIIMTDGSNYNAAHEYNFITLSNRSNTIALSYVKNDNYIELVDALEIKNNSKISTPAYINMSLSSTTNITVYYSSTPVAAIFPTLSELGTPIGTSLGTLVTGNNTTSTASVWYISIYITGTVSSDTLTMSYYTSGTLIEINYSIYAQ